MNKLKLLLTLPGGGVHTVHTARERKERLLEAIFGTKNMDRARKIWEKNIDELDISRPLVLGIPSDNGGGIQRGANWGPLAIRGEILREKDQFTDVGDVRVIPHLLHDKYLNEKTIRDCRKALYGKSVKLPVSPLSIAEEAVKEIYKTKPAAKILGFGGDHSTSYPLVKEWILSRKDKKKAGILHFDAHTDLLEERLGIDLCFGTWTFQILEFLKSRDHLLQIGIRSSGKTKAYWKKTLGIEQIWADEVNKNGAEKTIQKISKHFKKLGVEELYISFDIDALDEKYAAATGTPEQGGLLPTDCAAIIRVLSKEFRITGADLMEVAPFVLPEGVEERDQKSSLTVAGDIARILLGVLRA
jgi:agmatinase